MPTLAHQHQWSHAPGGLLCIIPPCTAFFNPAEMQANLTNAGSTRSNVVADYNDIVNQAWKKAGH